MQQTLMLIFALGERKHIDTINIDDAIIYHIVLTLLLYVGWLVSKKEKTSYRKPEIAKINIGFFIFAYFFAAIGLFTSILTVAYVYPLYDYLNLLFYYQENFSTLRDIKHNWTVGGISGAVKMLNYSPLAIFLAVSSLLQFYRFKNHKDRVKLIYVLAFALICSLLKIIFSLDRLTLLGIVMVVSYVFLFASKKIKIFLGASILILFLLLSVVTSVKMSGNGFGSVFDFLRLYCQLGLTNFQLLLEHHKNYSYGFNTFLMPLYFVCVFFNVIIEIPHSEYVVWDNAQYFYGYLYLDFGDFSIIVIFLLGFLLSKYQNLVNLNHKTAISVFFVILFSVSTFIVVPIVRSVEFWWLIIVAYSLSFFVIVSKGTNK